MTLTLSDPPKKPRKTRAKTAGPDPVRLARLAALVDEWLPRRRAELIVQLRADEGLILTAHGSGVTECTLAGVTAGSTAGEHMALANWAAAARRTIARARDAG